MSSSSSNDSLYTSVYVTLPSAIISATGSNSMNNTNNQQLKKLIRYIMRTFYSVPKSLVVEYIYHYKCIRLQDLANCLHLKAKEIRSYIEPFKRDRCIIEEHRSNESYYKFDIDTFIKVTKYRLIQIQLNTSTFKQIQTNYKCDCCSKEYSEMELARLSKYSTANDVMCTECDGIVNESDQMGEGRASRGQCVDMRLYNEQMAPLFEILRRIDELMKHERLTARNCQTDQDDHAIVNLTQSTSRIIVNLSEENAVSRQSKPLPEWFLRSTIDSESND